MHEFCVYTARNYSEPMMRHAVQATKLLLQTVKAGVGASTVARVLAQVPFEKLVGPWREPERALLQSPRRARQLSGALRALSAFVCVGAF